MMMNDTNTIQSVFCSNSSIFFGNLIFLFLCCPSDALIQYLRSVFSCILLYLVAFRTCFTALPPGWPCVTDSCLSQPSGQTEPHLSKPQWQQHICMGQHLQTVTGVYTTLYEAFTTLHSERTHAKSPEPHRKRLTGTSQPHPKSTEKSTRQVFFIPCIWLQCQGTCIS